MTGVWDHLDVSLRMADFGFGVNGDARSLSVWGPFDDEVVVGCGGESVDGGVGQERVGGHREPLRGFPVGDPDGACL